MCQNIVMTADGKLVTDAATLKRFKIPSAETPSRPLVASETLDELSVIILPIIMGGHEAVTVTGTPGAFLKIPVEFELTSKRMEKEVCYLRYRRNVIAHPLLAKGEGKWGQEMGSGR